MSTLLRRLPFATGRRQVGATEPRSERAWRRYERHRLMINRLLIVGAVVTALVVVLVVLVVAARAHYERGRDDLDAGRYEKAAAEFAKATVLLIPYGDASELRLVAEREASAGDNYALLSPSPQIRQYSSLLHRMLRYLRDRRYIAAASALHRLRREFPGYPLTLGPHGSRAAVRAAEALVAIAGERFREQRWESVAPYVSAALVFQPSWSPALELERRADLYASVAPSFERAQRLAAHGSWARAAALLRPLIAKAPGYPGATGLLATAKTKLKARKRPSDKAVVPAVSPSPSPSPSPTPSPKPTPTLPPPP